jgi:hypothetical protein
VVASAKHEHRILSDSTVVINYIGETRHAVLSTIYNACVVVVFLVIVGYYVASSSLY